MAGVASTCKSLVSSGKVLEIESSYLRRRKKEERMESHDGVEKTRARAENLATRQRKEWGEREKKEEKEEK